MDAAEWGLLVSMLDGATPATRRTGVQMVESAWTADALNAADCLAVSRGALSDDAAPVRLAGLDLAERLWRDGAVDADRLVRTVRECTRDEHGRVCSRSFDVLEAVAAAESVTTADLVAVVVARIEDADAAGRRRALESVQAFADAADLDRRRVGVAVADRVETDPDTDVRRDAVRTLDALDPPAICAGIAAALGDTDRFVRRAAARALDHRPDCLDADAVAEALVEAADADRKTLPDVSTVLQRSSHERARAGLLALTDDPNPTTRSAALNALRDAEGEGITDAFVEALDDPDVTVRENAYRLIGDRADDRLPDVLLDGLADPDPHVRLAAADALAPYADLDHVRDRLRTVADDPAEPELVREGASYVPLDSDAEPDDSLSMAALWQAVIALIYPALALWTVARAYQHGDGRETLSIIRTMFLTPGSVAYLLGHALYWVIALYGVGAL